MNSFFGGSVIPFTRHCIPPHCPAKPFFVPPCQPAGQLSDSAAMNLSRKVRLTLRHRRFSIEATTACAAPPRALAPALIRALALACLAGTAKAQEQYKRIGLEGISEIVSGNPDAAIERFNRHLAMAPDDAESQFGLALAHAARGDLAGGVAAARAAIADGLPAGRFVAGPRPLVEPLRGDAGFQALLAGAEAGLVSGPMLGSLTDRSAAVWLRFGKPQDRAFLRVTGDAYERTLACGPVGADTDFVAKLHLDGLRPASGYRYEVLIGGEAAASGTFRTFPEAGRPARFSVAFGGGAGYTPEHERIWTTIRDTQPDALLLLGDNVYIDTPEEPLVQKYCYYRRQARPEFRQLVRDVPVFAIWDDHDFGTNDCLGSPETDMPAWKRPVFELFRQQWVNPGYGGGDRQPGCWFDFTIADVHFIMLDGRYYRTSPRGPAPTMLGAAQKAWLLDTLQQSTGTFKILVSPVPWSRNTKPGSRDTWDGFDAEREEIFRFIADREIGGVFLLAADRHRSDCWRTDRPDAYPLYEFMSSCLTNMHRHENMAGSLFSYNDKNAFGRLVFDTADEDPTVRYQIITIDGAMTHSFKLRRSELEW